jgi:uncharacterized protein YndB with AHSA1/START domain
MATIRVETCIDAPADRVWDAIRDYGALHTRLVPGFVVDTRLEGDSRMVTFGNGMIARERIVAVDDQARRFAYGVVGERMTHHSASNQVFEDGEGRCRFVWIADVLPDAAAETMEPMMRQGADVLKATLESAR